MSANSVFIQCSACDTKNRIPLDKLTLKPLCGQCKADLDVRNLKSAEPLELTDSIFETLLSTIQIPVLVDFWAPWCSPCRQVAPILEELARELEGKLIIAKVNTDQNPINATKYRISGIPTFLIFKQGKLIDTLVGALPKQALKSRLAEHLR